MTRTIHYLGYPGPVGGACTEADQLDDYFKAITENPDLETVLVDASRWGMCITRKMK